MATNITGSRTVGLQTDLNSLNILPELVLVDGDLDAAKLLAFLNIVPWAPTYNKKYNFFEDAWLPATDTTSAAVSGTNATTIPVTTILAYNIGHVWRNKRTKELMLVTGKSTSSGTIDVIRALGRDTTNSTGTAAAAINSGDTLQRLGASQGETTKRQVAQSTLPTEVFNYAEKKRYEVEMSDWQRKTKHETGVDWDYQVDKTMRQARKDLNGWLYYGERNTMTVDNELRYTAGGLNFFVSTNLLSVTGVLHSYTFNEWLQDEAMFYGPSEKTGLFSAGVVRSVTEMMTDIIQVSPVNLGTDDMKAGISVITYMSPTGALVHLTEDRCLTTMANGDGFVTDLRVCRLRHFSGDGLDGRPHWMLDTQDTDSDAFSQAILMDIGGEFGPEKHHAKVSGVTNGGAAGRAVS